MMTTAQDESTRVRLVFPRPRAELALGDFVSALPEVSPSAEFTVDTVQRTFATIVKPSLSSRFGSLTAKQSFYGHTGHKSIPAVHPSQPATGVTHRCDLFKFYKCMQIPSFVSCYRPKGKGGGMVRPMTGVGFVAFIALCVSAL